MLKQAARSILASLALTTTALSGCVATAGVDGEVVYGYPVTVVDVAPVEIETYPRVEYHGSYAYLVEGRWYYRGPRGWVVFRREPQELRRYRTQYPSHDRVPRGRRGGHFEAGGGL